MIHFEFYNFIVPIKTLDKKYPGKLKYFIKDVPNNTYTDDGQLASVRFLSLNEANEFVDLVAKKGLHFHRMDFMSDDFTVCTSLGMWWNVNWLNYHIGICSYNELEHKI